jgi:single-strand DNA-binding protein
MNIVVLSGRLVNDPELAYTNTGTAIYRNVIAVDDFGKNEKQTHFFKFTCFSAYAESVAKYTYKGQPVTVSGRLVMKKWVNKEGQKNSAVEINVDKIEYHQFKQSGEQVPELLRGSVQLSDDELPF